MELTEQILFSGLMGLAGIIIAALFWYGVIKNI
jgi:hypothetical protein